MAKSLMNLFDCFLDDFRDEKYLENISDLDVRAQLEVINKNVPLLHQTHIFFLLFQGVFFFSCIWSIGGPLDTDGRNLFSTVFRGLLEKEFPAELYKNLGMFMEIPPPHKPYIFLIPKDNSVFDYRYIKEVSTIFKLLILVFNNSLYNIFDYF